MPRLRILFLLAILGTPVALFAQQPSLGDISRVTGVDSSSQIAYVLISTPGRLLNALTAPVPPPRLTAQCTRTLDNKLKFELLADFGNIPQPTFYPPWKPSGPNDLFPPRLPKFQFTMEFLGYTRVKPVKRQWEELNFTSGQYRYATPGIASANMESISFYLQYLRALPTLRLTSPKQGIADFETTAWQQALKSEPLCHAANL